MPQFDPAFFAPQLFWLAVTFITLYVLMAKVALPKIGAVLDERQRKIDDNLDKAAQLKAEAEAAVAAYEKALSESRAHAHSVIKEASERLSKQAEERTRDLSAKLAQQIKAGEARIAAAKDAALTNVREVALDVAGATVSRLVGGNADQAKLEAAVASALKEQGQ
ncbi:F0F1 ATP synthase subunit B family protein [Magnetospirillum gryphiswaldense]|jgi:F-type H+-transporting ATPase subunit b|uniref:ATP synthase subunit b n=2 Tax=Magnetospirillum gryphiswaldense TaxID=55518 RepID=V6F4R1_MAGGM|nr:ATP synthase subunit B', membrane-bound, F0 sector [Magnetospirillum gryphiswaldense]AVM74750.1 ATP synthase subunit b 2 [Magnetospirillum gryphiswaldense MSR-1]AVM78653.1 ATP synthase subunit b 2 [Magnetospirillum gryphiswaldense]CAM75631.1 ATP synthase B' chain [Magnetospirillum gryphiswaldense MSR-1]CDK99483.1 ATP synthase subunit B', membrane-bound, F0 sector [Magnetospirillum gryphiswaldense MSR-1 v2]